MHSECIRLSSSDGTNGYYTRAGYVDEVSLKLMAKTLLDYFKVRKVTYAVAELVLDEAKKMLDTCTLGDNIEEIPVRKED